MGSLDPAAFNSEREMAPRLYWEARARRFSGERAGLAAVCSYGMPLFYNGYIHVTQWLALAPWLRVSPGTSVLDVGCGVGRWSRRLARAGARVTGVDLAPTMVAEARRRAARDGVAARCRFLVADLASPATDSVRLERHHLTAHVENVAHLLLRVGGRGPEEAGEQDRDPAECADHRAP